jgi:outer membrane lipoprotein-sorting protein
MFLMSNALGSEKKNIIKNLKNINNLTFNFEQNINGKIEIGNCTIKFSKKIFCNYNLKNKKILVSNGKSLVIKTINSFYIYPIKRTPLNLILDKEFLINKIISLDEKIIDNKYINYSFSDKENEINIFFDRNTYDLIGWQTLDIYQNLSITYLSSIVINTKLEKNFFKLPAQN